MEQVDVVVVGGRLAGCALAAPLARARGVRDACTITHSTSASARCARRRAWSSTCATTDGGRALVRPPVAAQRQTA